MSDKILIHLNVNERRVSREVGVGVVLKNVDALLFECLAKENGSIIERATLLAVGWPSRIVHPNSLNMAIKSIRDSMNSIGCDDFIITHAKQGFSINEKYLVVVASSTNTPKCLENYEPTKDELITDERLSMPSDYHSQRDFRRITLKSTELTKLTTVIFRVLVLFSFLTALVFGLFLFSIRTNTHCHIYKDAQFCGVGEFRDDLELDVSKGEHYIFGYNYPSGDFVYEKVNN